MVTDTKPYRVTLCQENINRSGAQNRLYSSWVSILAKHSGHTAPRIRYLLRKMYLGNDVFTDNKGVAHERLISTAELTVKQMQEHMDRVEAWAAGFNIQLPKPIDLGRR